MCLGIPMQIESIDGFKAVCMARGTRRDVGLFFLQHEALAPGDIVMVHNGRALSKMTEDQARSAWETYDEILALAAGKNTLS
jgi:hydrogenase expression/formation protein HypC